MPNRHTQSGKDGHSGFTHYCVELQHGNHLSAMGNSDDPHLEDVNIQFHASLVCINAFVWNGQGLYNVHMETICHYTSICNDFEPILSSILHPGWIDLRATYYQKFDTDDYMWVKKYKDTIVQEICEEQKQIYINNSFDFKPYIISFCTNSDSEYMWEEYGNQHRGIMFEFDKDTLRKTHHNKIFDEPSSVELECFCPCLYVDDKDGEPNLSDIKSSLLETANRIDDRGEGDWNFQNKLELAMNAVKKKKPFEKEEEWRYINLYPVACMATYNPQSKDLCDITEPDAPRSEWYKHILFPKNSLIGVTVGSKVSDYNFQSVINYVKKCGFSSEIVNRQSK